MGNKDNTYYCSNLEYAKRELEMAGLFDKEKDFYKGRTGKVVLELCKILDNDDYSDMSPNFIISLLKRVIYWEPLTPLTGENDEWVVVDKNLKRNKRCSRVFIKNGVAYDSTGYVFITKQGFRFTCAASKKEITFPYYPKETYIREGTSEAEAFEGVFKE